MPSKRFVKFRMRFRDRGTGLKQEYMIAPEEIADRSEGLVAWRDYAGQRMDWPIAGRWTEEANG